MKTGNIQQINFKSVYTKDNHFSERERELEHDISGKLLGKVKPGDKQCRTWNEWLKKEKGIDVFIKRTPGTFDMLTVFGVKNVKNFDDAEKMKNFFVVGNYHTKDFEPEDIMTAYKRDKNTNRFSIGAITILCLGLIGGLIDAFSEKKIENFKEPPHKVIQMKDSLATDTLKMTKLIKK